MAELLGFTIVPPVEPYSIRDEVVSVNGALDQLSFGTTAQKYGFRVGLKPDRKGSTRLAAKMAAFRERYGYTNPFNFEVPQEYGIQIPSLVLETRTNIDKDDTSFEIQPRGTVGLLDAPVEIGSKFQFEGFPKLYIATDTAVVNNRGRERISVARNRILNDVPIGTRIEFNPTIQVVIDAHDPKPVSYTHLTLPTKRIV